MTQHWIPPAYMANGVPDTVTSLLSLHSSSNGVLGTVISLLLLHSSSNTAKCATQGLMKVIASEYHPWFCHARTTVHDIYCIYKGKKVKI